MWGVFQDHRGVLHCERINEGIECWTKELPAVPEKKNLWGKVTRKGRPAETKLKAVFLESHYSKRDYTDNAFEPAPAGFTLNPMMHYMRENRWGPVEVMLKIEDDEIGKRLHDGFRRFAPHSDSKGPRVGNDRLLEIIRAMRLRDEIVDMLTGK